MAYRNYVLNQNLKWLYHGNALIVYRYCIANPNQHGKNYEQFDERTDYTFEAITIAEGMVKPIVAHQELNDRRPYL